MVNWKNSYVSNPLVVKVSITDKFVAKFGLTAEQFAKNCESEFLIHQVESEPVDPEVTAENFISP